MNRILVIAALLIAVPAFAGPASKKGRKATPAEVEANKKAIEDAKKPPPAPAPEPPKPPPDRHVKVTVGDGGFEPSSVESKVGEVLFLDVTRNSDKACATIFEVNGEKKKLDKGAETSVKVDTSKAGDFKLNCPAIGVGGAKPASLTVDVK